jgi:tetrahydrodipicolinate N-succinyltransferase
MNENSIFAAGIGLRNNQVITYGKAFIEHENNHDAVSDFLKIISVYCDYSNSNIVISLENIDLEKLKKELTNAGHNGSVEAIEKLATDTNKENLFICIMETNEPPKNIEESYLILQLFSDGALNALNEKHRTPLTKVFNGLPTIPLNASGYPVEAGEVVASNDKFINRLAFDIDLSNRFVPTSFARVGSHFGKRNTMMNGVAINFGVSIGDDNLIDGHASLASCVQLGSRNKVGSFVSMEGVLSPVNEKPVIVGDDNFFGTRCRVGTGLIIGNKNFWGAGVNLSKGTPLRDMRPESKTFLQYVNASSENGIQGQNETMVTVNNAVRTIHGITVYPGEFLLNTNTPENQARFDRNDDLNSNN